MARWWLLPCQYLRNGVRRRASTAWRELLGLRLTARRFRIIFFSNNGPFTDEGNRYEGKVDGDKLTFEGPARYQYDLDDEGRIRANADGTISVAWWLRDDTGVWRPWMNNTFRRLKE